MNKYLCINKITKKVEYFSIIFDRINDYYRILDTKTSEIQAIYFNTKEEVKEFLERYYNIKKEYN